MPGHELRMDMQGSSLPVVQIKVHVFSLTLKATSYKCESSAILDSSNLHVKTCSLSHTSKRDIECDLVARTMVHVPPNNRPDGYV